jgi:hypothetical protein
VWWGRSELETELKQVQTRERAAEKALQTEEKVRSDCVNELEGERFPRCGGCARVRTEVATRGAFSDEEEGG